MGITIKSIVLALITLVAVVGVFWFGYFRNDAEKEAITINGVVAAVEENTITVNGIVEKESKTMSILVTEETEFIKKVHIMPRGLENGETFDPEIIQEPGVFSDIESNTVIRAVIRTNPENGPATAVTIFYVAFSFQQ